MSPPALTSARLGVERWALTLGHERQNLCAVGGKCRTRFDADRINTLVDQCGEGALELVGRVAHLDQVQVQSRRPGHSLVAPR